MINNLTIRQAKKEDFDQIFELILQLESVYGDWTEELRKNKNICQNQLEKMLKNEAVTIQVAEIDNKIIACLTYYPLISIATACEPTLEIVEFCVDENLRNQKIGTKMLKYLEEKAKKQGFIKLSLSSNIARKDAHRFYLNNGFKEVGICFKKKLI